MAITEKIKGIVDFLTQGLEQQEDGVFEDMMNEAGEEYETEDNLALAPAYQQTPFNQRSDRANLNVISHPTVKGGSEVMIMEPRSFGEAGQIVQCLKDRKTIVLNLHLLDKEQSQRTIDFVCGASHALGGTAQKISDMVFIFTPSNVSLSVENGAAQSKFVESLWNRPQ